MKLTKSKQFLADAIHSSGKGWPDGANWACQHKRMKRVVFTRSAIKPHVLIEHNGWDVAGDCFFSGFKHDKLSQNWHQTVLSREEYFSAYPAEPVADADGWIEWQSPFFGEMPVCENEVVDIRVGDDIHTGFVAKDWKMWGVVTHYRLHKPEVKHDFCESVTRTIPEPTAKPTIEQLAADYRNAKDYADRKQKEADDAKVAADAAFGELVAAGKAIDLVIGIATPEPELVITDWRDLLERDVIWFGGDDEQATGEYSVLEVEHEDYGGNRAIRIDTIGSDYWVDVTDNWKFIRRP